VGRQRATAASFLFLACVCPLAGQTGPSVDNLPDSPGGTMEMLLERTILKVDVLKLTVRVDPPAASRLAGFAVARGGYDREFEDAIVDLLLETDRAVASVEFKRSIGLDQFLDGVDEDLGRAVAAGWVEPEAFREITAGLREWLAFLATRGIKKGDRLVYEKNGETLRTTYLEAGAGELSLDQTDSGPQYVMAFWGGYFAPGTTFREGLSRSLWELPN
jgi:hypothetical protein